MNFHLNDFSDKLKKNTVQEPSRKCKTEKRYCKIYSVTSHNTLTSLKSLYTTSPLGQTTTHSLEKGEKTSNFGKNDSDFRVISGYLDIVGAATLSRTRPLSRSQLFPGRLALNRENWTFPGAPASFSGIVCVTAPGWLREQYGGVKWFWGVLQFVGVQI